MPLKTFCQYQRLSQPPVHGLVTYTSLPQSRESLCIGFVNDTANEPCAIVLHGADAVLVPIRDASFSLRNEA